MISIQAVFNFNCYIDVNSHSFKKHDFSRVIRDLESTDWEAVFHGLDLTDSWDILIEKITRLLEKHVPVKKGLIWAGQEKSIISSCAVTCDFQQCGILTCVDSDEPVKPPVKLRNSK